MPAPPNDARSLTATVHSIEPTGDDGILLTLETSKALPELRASRFFMLRRTNGTSPGIPRPFSIYRHDGRLLTFLIKLMGHGTRALGEASIGESITLIGPLGNGWPTLDGSGDPWVFLGGGVGAAPFPMAIEQALRGMDGAEPVTAGNITYLIGAATQGLLYDFDSLLESGVRVKAATDDGSFGYHGNVLQLLQGMWERDELPRRVRLLACGPDPMLAAVERLAGEHDLPCWLSLETLMGCGVGICNGCPVPTLPEGSMGEWGNAKCCVEGPVFSTEAISLLRH